MKKSILFDVTSKPYFSLNSKFNIKCKQDSPSFHDIAVGAHRKNKLEILINIQIKLC